jgi:hypothetical protein
MNRLDEGGSIPARIQYLWTSEQLLSPEVGAVEIGLLEREKFAAIRFKMEHEAASRGIERPLMVADLIFQEGKRSELGSSGQPYPITEAEWEQFVADVPTYCGDRIPKIYMVDGNKFTAPI